MSSCEQGRFGAARDASRADAVEAVGEAMSSRRRLQTRPNDMLRTQRRMLEATNARTISGLGRCPPRNRR
jgi:hypothetical protein